MASKRVLIVVEGCGSWAMRYFNALKKINDPGVGVIFTYDSTFGLDEQAAKLPARLYSDYLNATLRNADLFQSVTRPALRVECIHPCLRRFSKT